MLVVVERRKADQGFPKGHQNGPRHGQQPWRRIGREPNGNTGSQGSKMKTPRNQPRNGGGPKTQNDRGREGQGEGEGRKGEETRRGGNREQRHGKARHYFNVFALKLDVRSCPGLLPGIQRAGLDLVVDVIHE